MQQPAAKVLLAKARENVISPFLYFRLKKADVSGYPKEFLEGIKADYYSNLARNILIWKELKPILQAFLENEVGFILLKGIALSMTVYPDFGVRPMSDVDILVKDNDLPGVNRILSKFGYTPADRSPFEGKPSPPNYLTTLDYRRDDLSIHLHWHLVNSSVPSSYSRRIDIPRIFSQASVIEYDTLSLLSLSPEHLIIYLCEHGLRVRHSFRKLIYFLDIFQAIEYYREKMNWEILLEESRRFGLERMVYYGLYGAFRIMEAKVPPRILSLLKPRHISPGERFFLFLLLRRRSFSGLSYFVHLAMNKGLKGKVWFIFRTFFPPKRVLAQKNCLPVSAGITPAGYLYWRRFKEIFGSLSF